MTIFFRPSGEIGKKIPKKVNKKHWVEASIDNFHSLASQENSGRRILWAIPCETDLDMFRVIFVNFWGSWGQPQGQRRPANLYINYQNMDI